MDSDGMAGHKHGENLGLAVDAGAIAAPFLKGFSLLKGLGTVGETIRGVGPAYNVAKGSQLAESLTLQSARSPFTATGELTKDALNASKAIPNLGPGQMINSRIPTNVGKYTTETFQSPSGNFQVHFYMDPKTREVIYSLDYKSIFNSMSGVPKNEGEVHSITRLCRPGNRQFILVAAWDDIPCAINIYRSGW